MLAHYPALAWLFATFNGIYLPGALKQKIKAQGLTQGVLDLWLPCRREEPDGTLIPGLAMDLKSAKGRPTPKQLEWAAMLISNGWRVYFPSSAQEAWWLIASYLGIIGKDHYAKTLQLRSDYQKHLTGNSEHP
jgi:hypothetical protein